MLNRSSLRTNRLGAPLGAPLVTTLAALFTSALASAQVEDLGSLPGGHAYAYNISADGQVAALSLDPYPIFADGNTARWTAAGGIEFLDPSPGVSSSIRSHAISSDGAYVAGRIIYASGSERAGRWGPTGLLEDLGSLGGDSFPQTISEDGETVVGFSDLLNGDTHAFVWTSGAGMADVHPNAAPAGSRSYAARVSEDGSAALILVGDTASSTVLRMFL